MFDGHWGEDHTNLQKTELQQIPTAFGSMNMFEYRRVWNQEWLLTVQFEMPSTLMSTNSPVFLLGNDDHGQEGMALWMNNNGLHFDSPALAYQTDEMSARGRLIALEHFTAGSSYEVTVKHWPDPMNGNREYAMGSLEASLHLLSPRTLVFRSELHHFGMLNTAPNTQWAVTIAPPIAVPSLVAWHMWEGYDMWQGTVTCVGMQLGECVWFWSRF
jgi:hypothetical protein